MLDGTASLASALAYGFASVPTSYVFAFATDGATGSVRYAANGIAGG